MKKLLMALLTLSLLACGDSGPTDIVPDSQPDDTEDVFVPEAIEYDIPEIEVEVEEEDLRGGFGFPCESNMDCLSGYCVHGPEGQMCTIRCTESCPPDFFCKGIEGETDVVFLCMPRTDSNCDACRSDLDCNGGRCLDLDGGQYCAESCQEDRDCPVGYNCETVEGDERKRCLPEGGVCSCDDTTVGWSRECSLTISANGQSTTCLGAELCGPSGWSACQMPEEVCNGLDDDCDGIIDNGFRNSQGKYDHDQHCGACNVSCLALNFPNASPFCDASGSGIPTCSYECDPGWVDVNELPGCDCRPTSTTDIPDPFGIDANCDGIDGEVTKSIFVAKTGSDQAPGTIDAPLRTIQAGISRARSQGKRDVLVATGVYVESISLEGGVNVYGGYSADFRQRDIDLHESAIMGVDATSQRKGAVNAKGIGSSGSSQSTLDGFTIFGADNPNPGGNAYTVHLHNVGPFVTISNNTIIGGSGAAGLAGTKGTDGARGTDGSAGAVALWSPSVRTCGSSQQSAGGRGGNQTCGGVSVSGGQGGTRYCPTTPTNVQEGTQTPPGAARGSAGSGSLAGAGGVAGWHQAVTGDCTRVSSPNNNDTFGADGKPGTKGQNGTAAPACGSTIGSVTSSGEWQSTQASNGRSGSPGSGGGGGGSGGGVDVRSCSLRIPVGGSGGGGGSGGCGGSGGEAGSNGGGSFAIFLAYDSAPNSLPSITDNEIYRGRGGAGGVGGPGGVGGGEGLGGAGGSSRRGLEQGSAFPFNCCSSGGGAGAPGGAGGHGAGGNGGCGGPSYGIFLDPIALGTSRNAISNNALPTSGGGGLGGEGGPSFGHSGEAGSDGANLATNY